MKKYIIFCYNITGMGGGQQYVNNKASFLMSQGFDVTVFSTIEGEIVIQGLSCYKRQIFKELKYPPCAFNKVKIYKVVRLITSGIEGKYEEILIESDGGYETQWAEIIAKKLGAQHIVFSVAEQQNKDYSADFLDFLFFKYQRKELYGIKKDSIKLLFKGYKDIEDSDKYAFSAACINVVDESDNTNEFNFPKADYSIAGIWRTNKEGFVECMESIIPFIRRHEDKTFNIIIIGAGSEENEKKVKTMYLDLKNVKLIFMGFMYPIPKALILSMDVFVSTAGSSRIPVLYGIPSISVTSAKADDGSVSFYALGILNYTTKNTVVPEVTGYTTSEFLEEVLIEGYCKKHSTLGMELYTLDKEDVERRLKEQLSKFRSIEITHYDISKIKPKLKNEKGYSLIGRTFGAKALFMADFLGHYLKTIR